MADQPVDLAKYRERHHKREETQEGRSQYKAELSRLAFENFSAYRDRLSRQDRKAIALKLGEVVNAYYEDHPDEERYLLLKVADLTDENSTKVLHRLVLKESERESDSAINRLYASPDKYHRLIKAIADRTSQDEQYLTGSILFGTSFYPVSPGSTSSDIDEVHLILVALQEAANRIDREFHLLEQFSEVARLRNWRESIFWDHVAVIGEFPDIETWHGLDKELHLPQPDWPDAWPASDRRFNHENGLWWPLDDWRLTDENFWLDENPRAPDSAFWVKGDPTNPNAARVCDNADFFFVPHVYLGMTLCMDITPPGYFLDSAIEELPNLPELHALWDESSHSYTLRQPESVVQNGAAGTNYEFDELTSTAAHWLVIYPHPVTGKLFPMIYAMGELPGAELIPLSPDLIAEFGDTQRWKYFGKDAPTLLQRLRSLTGYGTGDFKIYDSWRETAARFHWNPILRKHPECIDDIRYRKHLSSWLRGERSEVGIEVDDED